MTNALATIEDTIGLPELIDKASWTLSEARTSAEVLEARDLAGLVYDTAKRAARLSQAKGAHDTLVAAAHRVQADALLIESQAKYRLADEYDAAQERGEMATRQNNPGSVGHVLNENMPPATASDIGLTRKAIHEARKIRDAEKQEPGIVARVIKEAVDSGKEPTRALVKRAIAKVAKPKKEEKPEEESSDGTDMKNYIKKRAEADEKKYIEDRDFAALKKLWKKTCPGAQQMFRDWAGF